MATIKINPAYENERVLDTVEAALLGRRIIAISRDAAEDSVYGDTATIVLDNGTILQLDGHDGGCACTAGCYSLQHLAELEEVDNVITSVDFVSNPGSDESYDSSGYYRIFVFAGAKQVNLATFEGDDGNGYYGTGYYLKLVTHEEVTPSNTTERSDT